MRANGFFGHIKNNESRVIAVFLGFLLAFQLMGMSVAVPLFFFIDPEHMPHVNFWGYMGRYGAALFALSLLVFFYQLFVQLWRLKDSLNFQPVSAKTQPRLYRLAEVQAIGAGIPMPKVAVIPSRARNAFACGLSQKSATLVVTRGLLEALDDEELEAVIAHEITHIVRGDIRLMAVVNAALATCSPKKENEEEKTARYFHMCLAIIAVPPLGLIALIGCFIFGVAYLLSKLCRLFLATSREYIADAEAVRMTKNPAALISALKAIEGQSAVMAADPAVDAMMIDGVSEGPFATHPPISERIKVICQHAGGMVYANTTRKDTRDPGFTRSVQRAEFGMRSGQKPLRQTGEKSFAQRFNTGSENRFFGLVPQKSYMVVLAVCFVALTSYSSDHHPASKFMDFETVQKEMTEPFDQLKAFLQGEKHWKSF